MEGFMFAIGQMVRHISDDAVVPTDKMLVISQLAQDSGNGVRRDYCCRFRGMRIETVVQFHDFELVAADEKAD